MKVFCWWRHLVEIKANKKSFMGLQVSLMATLRSKLVLDRFSAAERFKSDQYSHVDRSSVPKLSPNNSPNNL